METRQQLRPVVPAGTDVTHLAVAVSLSVLADTGVKVIWALVGLMLVVKLDAVVGLLQSVH